MMIKFPLCALKHVGIVVLVLFSLGGFTQNDSLDQVKTDSLLSDQLNQGEELLSMVDSVRMADSLEQVALQREIDELRASDARKKAKLQARLDSLQAQTIAKELRVKNQVDSLRNSTKGIPVVFFEDTLFQIFSKLGPFRPIDRAQSITDKLQRIVENGEYDSKELKILEGDESHDIMYGDIILLSVVNRDAFWLDRSREEVAQFYLEEIDESVLNYLDRTSVFRTSMRLGSLLLILLVLVLLVRLLNKGFGWLSVRLLSKTESLFSGVKFRNYEFLSKERETQLVTWLLNSMKWLAVLILMYLALPLVFSIFPSTSGYATTLIDYVLDPVKMFFHSFVNYIPNLLTIGVIVFFTHNFVRFMKFLASEISSEKLVIPGFYPEWAFQTFNLLRFLVYAFSLVIIFPYLPGSDSLAFQGVSVFLGLLISMGSSSAISNIIAGLVITYMRAFKIGDRVKIGDTVGDVVEKTMLVTRLRTIKNEEVSIPNSAIMNGSTINFSYSAEHNIGLILHTTVTIGYDVPWRTVHELLINAALKTEKLKHDPTPFVLQTSLDDFYVSYQINAYTDYSRFSAKIYSDIHSNIQDGFNEAGVEILSPHYRAARDGSAMTVPPQYLPENYKAPSFNVNMTKDGKPE